MLHRLLGQLSRPPRATDHCRRSVGNGRRLTMGRTASVVSGIRFPDSEVASVAEQLSREAFDRMLCAHAVRSDLQARA